MAVIRLTPGLGWHLAGVFSLLAVAAPGAQAPRQAAVIISADVTEKVPTVAPAVVTAWMRLLSASGRPAGHERLVVLDADGAVIAQVEGQKESVLVPEDVAEKLCSQPIGATLLHNHPDLAGLSAADLDMLAHAGVRRVVAIAADGTTFAAAAGPSFAETWASRLRSDVPARVRARVADEALRQGVPPAAVAMHEAHLTAMILRRLGVVDYRVSPSITARLAYDRNRSIFDRVVDAETAALTAAPPAPRGGR
jgi:hypothetical protein